MHAAARRFLIDRGLMGSGAAQIPPENVFFELTKGEHKGETSRGELADVNR